MKRDDSLWKAILEDVFDDFLIFFFKDDVSLLDLQRGFVFLDKELEQLFPSDTENNSPKFVDKLVKVFTKTGSEEWILVHVEVQGYNDSSFAKRMYSYFYRILDHYNKPVTCIAIFTDSNKNFRPSTFTYSFLGTETNFKYNIYKIIDQQENELRDNNNPFALVILSVLTALKSGKISDENLLSLKIGLVKMLLQRDISPRKIRSIITFLRLYVRFDNAEIITKFDKELSLLTNKHTTMGIEEFVLQRAKNEGIEKGIEIGISQKNLDFVKTLLNETNFSIQKIATMVGVPVSFVEEVKASLSASSSTH
jgi:predicted transposase/invertase (TIGR01784 family)